jgi:hypothetical protein
MSIFKRLLSGMDDATGLAPLAGGESTYMKPSDIDNYRNRVDRGAALLFDWLVETGRETQPQYDFLCIPVGAPRGRGMPETGRGLEETNMFAPGQLNPPSGFVTKSIHCFYGRGPAAEREAFRDSYTLEFQILCKVFYRVPLAALPPQGILFPWADKKPQEWPLQPGDFGDIPRYIGSMMDFKIRLIGKPVRLTAPLKFLPVLNGLMDMAVA